ncbi:MAG: HAD family hydrolase [Pseudomonadota bacterium]|nr:HAD family hydrolase [Pseudomonadota bacterium]
MLTLIRESNVPLAPRETALEIRQGPVDGIRAVLFDIYGTLLVSGSGDIGTVREDADTGAALTAMRSAGVIPQGFDIETDADALLEDTIRAHHTVARDRQIEFPEVNITKVWRDVIAALGLPVAQEGQLRRVAVEHECLTNPVWPMPGLKASLSALSSTGRRLGIVSNAQFYTPLTIEALTGRAPDGLGFEPRLCAWSWAQGEAKPSTRLFRGILQVLDGQYGIAPEETLYVGNDMLKDIWPASVTGCRTALFAGDTRSLRLRVDDDRVRGIEPDLVVDDLRQIPRCLR